MSRIGKRPIAIPSGVDIKVSDGLVSVKGKNGQLETRMPNLVTFSQEDGQLTVARDNDSGDARASQGLARTLIHNMVQGVTEGFSRKLLVEGVGYRAENRGDNYVLLSLGYSHQILYRLADGLTATIDARANSITISGIDKQKVGMAAAEIRSLRPPEPYKGKGVRYSDETIRRKEGKSRGK